MAEARFDREGEQCRALTTHIVAVINPGRDWAAYELRPAILPDGGHDRTGVFLINLPVPLVDYDYVARNGDKVPEAVARFFFSRIEEEYRG